MKSSGSPSPPGSSPQDSEPSPYPADLFLPPTGTLLKLIGFPTLLRALQEAGVERPLFQGFQPTVKSLTNPIVERRLRDLLTRESVRESIARQWLSRPSPFRDQVEALVDAGALPEAVEETGKCAWGLWLHPAPEARELLAILMERNIVERDIGGAPLAIGRESRNGHTGPPEVGAMGADLSALDGELARKNEKIASLESSLRERTRRLKELETQVQALTRELGSRRRREEEGERKTQDLERQVRESAETSRRDTRLVERKQRELDEANRRAATAERQLRQAQDRHRRERETQEQHARNGAEAGPAISKTPPSTATTDDWLAAGPAVTILAHLLETGGYRTVAEFAREALARSPALESAARLVEEALAAAGDQRELAAFHYDRALRSLEENHIGEAVRRLCESIRADPESDEASWRMDKLIHVARADDQEDLEPVAALHLALRRSSPETLARFESLVRQGRRSLWRRLPSAEARHHRQLVVEWSGRAGRQSLSAVDLAAAVASADVETVEEFRRWAASRAGAERQAAQQLIEGADSHLPGARRVLTVPTQAVVVDGSNVAWAGRSPMEGAAVENIRQVRHQLFTAEFFPVIILADAALRFQVDDRRRLERWLSAGEIKLVEGRTDADEELLREATRRSCPLVTNDLMREYDPEQRCPKIRVAVGPSGVRLQQTGEATHGARS